MQIIKLDKRGRLLVPLDFRKKFNASTYGIEMRNGIAYLHPVLEKR